MSPSSDLSSDYNILKIVNTALTEDVEAMQALSCSMFLVVPRDSSKSAAMIALKHFTLQDSQGSQMVFFVPAGSWLGGLNHWQYLFLPKCFYLCTISMV